MNLTLNGKGEVTSYSDPRTLSTAYIRNGFGGVKRETSPDRGITDTVYDLRGLTIQVTDGRGIVMAMTYDNAGRLATRTFTAAGQGSVPWRPRRHDRRSLRPSLEYRDPQGSAEPQ